MAKKVMVQRPLDGPRRLVAERIAELGLDMANLSRELGHNHAYLQQYVRYAIPAQLKEDDRHRLAALLRVDQRALKPGGSVDLTGFGESSGDEIAPLDAHAPGEVRAAPQVRFGGAQLRPENVPVRGVVRGGQGGSFELNIGDPIEYVRRPLSLIGKGEIYALHVESDSMAPRYEPGEIILVWAQRPALIGRDVVVQLRPSHDGENPRAYLKRLMKRNDKDLVLEQFNPRKTMSLKMKDVISVHMVLTRDEML
ncbi:MAG TPA: S24 family peptidase [Dongiaceae bacterium]|jgi:phage repressor protein C with HTH and peptisase S24 domain|nr:S24 family peptidase [Steroidobacteraceae bacterium]HVY97874.1 S24 family peptidase [Dongiaceae bacterium]